MTPSYSRRLHFPLFLVVSIFLLLAISHKTVHTYLEDDMFWMVPLVSQTIDNHSFVEILKIFHGEEMTLIDGLIGSFLILLFGFNFQWYSAFCIFGHFINTILFYLLLEKRICLSGVTSFWAALIYLTFLGHVHAYLWPLALHHQLVIFFIFLVFHFYFKTDKLLEEDKKIQKSYCLTLVCSLFASFQRISIFIIPFSILAHIFFTTKDPKRLIRKINLWIPIFLVISAYQLFGFIFGHPGNGLIDILRPFQDLFQDNRNILLFFFLLFSLVFFCLIFRFILTLPFIKTSFFPRILEKISFLTICVPKVLYFCFYIFFFSWMSIKMVPIQARGQMFSFPDHFWVKAIGLILIEFVLILFLIFMIKRKRHLILFIPWYWFVLPYLNTYEGMIPSRYFIYVSAIFSVIICTVLFEVLPDFFKKIPRLKLQWFCSALLFAAIISNIFFMNIWLHKNFMNDYHWSYDYIKISSLVKKDLEKEESHFSSEKTPICIEGTRGVPYPEWWKMSLLSDFDHAHYGPLRILLLSALKERVGGDRIITKECPLGSRKYTFNGLTLIDQQGISVELFYQYFDSALKAFEDNDFQRASIFIRRAVEERPFLINFLLGNGPLERLFKDWLTKEVSETIYDLCMNFYDADEKMDYIDTLIYKEARDYGRALALQSYVLFQAGDLRKSEKFLEKSYLFLPKADVLNFFNQHFLDLSKGQLYLSFLESQKDLWSIDQRESNTVQVTHYKGFNLFFASNFYIGLSETEGTLNLAKFKAKEYQGAFALKDVAKSKWKIRQYIDEKNSIQDKDVISLKSFDQGRQFVYGDFSILRLSDTYYVFHGKIDMIHNDTPNHLDEALFKSGSLLEIKLAVDQFLAL